MSSLTIEGISHRYATAHVVNDVSLDVAAGEFVTLLGPSGCGKTTTLRIIAGLERNTSGRVLIGDKVVSDPENGLFVPAEKRGLGMVFQSYAIWPHMTVFENVAYPLRVRREGVTNIRERVSQVLRLVEMTEFADRPAPALSGGQQQRIAIARALVAEPNLLLLDEPLSNLDTRLRSQMGVEFRALQRRLGITTIYVTHDQEEAMMLSDRIVVMQSGEVLQVGSPQEIYSQPASRDVAAFFSSPNLISGKVADSSKLSDGTYSLRVSGRGWKGSCLARSAFVPGESAWVMLRPEYCAVGTPGPNEPDHITFAGRVTDVVFQGSRRTVAVDVAGQIFYAQIPAAQDIADVMEFKMASRSAWAVRI